MLSETDEKYMALAIAEAKTGQSNGDLPFGAVIVQNGNVITTAHAENNSTGDVTDHAELLAIRRACRKLGRNNLEKCIIFTTNEPCIMCAAGIFQANIPKVVIGASRDDLPNLLRPRIIRIDNLAKDSGYPIEIKRGVLKEQILKLFNNIVR